MRSASLVAAVLLVLSLSPQTIGQKSKTRAVQEKVLIGYVSDASCGLEHMAGMDEATCTLMCAKNGKLVLADRENKIVYDLDKTGQEKAKEFAGKKVKVTGRLSRKTIKVASIEPA